MGDLEKLLDFNQPLDVPLLDQVCFINLTCALRCLRFALGSMPGFLAEKLSLAVCRAGRHGDVHVQG